MPALRLALRPLRPCALVLATICATTHLGSAADEPTPLPPAPSPPPAVEVLADVEVITPLRQPTRSASPIARTPVIEALQAVQTLSGPALDYRREGSLGATLAREPGVSTTGFGPGAGRPVIRGQGGERIRVLENGTGTLDVSGISDDHAVPVDPTSVDRLEVVRGPATLRYGASAIGGIVYAHDGRIPETPLGRRFMGRLGGAFGTDDTERSGFAVLSGQAGCWCWRAAGFARKTDDIDIPGHAKSRRQLEAEGNPTGVGEAFGTLPNSWTRTWGGSVGLSRVGTSGHTGMAISTYSTEYGLPNEADVHIEMDRLRLDAGGRYRYPLAGLREASWSLAFADYKHTEFEGPDAGTIFDQQAAEGRLELVHSPWGCWEGAFGLQGSLTDLQVTGAEALLPNARTATAGIFLLGRRALSSCWSLEVGGRYDLTSIESLGDETLSALSLSSGLLWKPTHGTVCALSTAYTERAPTAFELFASGPHVATETFEVGDPSLGLERGVGSDLSWRTDGRRLSASATAFYTRYLNYLALVPTGTIDIPSGLDIFNYVGHEAELYGLEAQVTWHAWRCGSGELDIEGLADWVRASDLDTGEPLPRIPPLRVGGGLAWHNPRWSARIDLLHAFEQDRTTSFERPTDGYTLLDAGVSRTWSAGCRSLTFALTGTNLLDEEVRLSTSFIKDLAPGRGRSLLLSVRVDF